MRLTDPRVKVLVPSLGRFGSDSMAAAFRRIGIRSEAVPASDRESLRLGRSATSGKECLPHIVCLGGLLKYLEQRGDSDPDERLAILLPKAAGYCRLGQYHVHTRQFIRRRGLRNVAVLDLSMEENYGGLGPGFTLWGWRSVMITDVMDDIELALRALAQDPETALAIYREESEKIWAALDGSSGVHWIRQLKRTASRFAAIPRKQSLDETARVAVVGEYYVRRDPFSNLGIANRLADRGFVVSMASLSELVYYTNFLMKLGLKEPNHTLQTRIEFFLLDNVSRLIERRIKRIFAHTGLYHMELVDAEDLVRYAQPIIPPENDGEQGLVAGTTMRDALTEFAGVVNVGPFGCMQIRFADAVTAPQATVAGKKQVLREIGANQDLSAFRDDERIPFLSVESDGNPYPQLLEARFESFCLAAERAAAKMGSRLAPKSTPADGPSVPTPDQDRRSLTTV
jgi:predicted nucleotide-binding protein (sugar kinase/HSP70/actin superfamily)